MTVETRAKATPGPWRDIGRGYIVHDEDGIEHHVAQVFNRSADVILIAAAPDLLAALERAWRIFGGHTGAPGDAITGAEIEQRAHMLDSMRAAILAAVGPEA